MNFQTCRVRRWLTVAACAGALAGCSSITVLDEPDPIPRFVQSYEASEFGEKVKRLAIELDLNDCVEHAMLVEKSVFGSSSIKAHFPVRALVAREFEQAVEENFHLSGPDDTTDLYIKVRTMRVLLTEHFSKVTCDLSMNVQVLHPDKTRRPVFRKTYRSQAYGPFEDGDEVPGCAYRTVQNIVEEFMSDISTDRKLASYFVGKANEK